MASLYEQLMASKGAPKAAAATNSTQLRKAPVSLRSAMRKYAAGGDVTDTAPDYSRAYGALGGAESVNNMRNQFLGMGIDENTIGSIFSKYYTPEPQQGMSPQTMTPPEPARYQPPPPPEEPRYEPRYEETRPDPRPDQRPERPEIRPVMPKIYPEDYAGPRNGGISQQPQGPQTSYRMNDDGSLVEIGFDNKPVSGYTSEQMSEYNRQRGIGEPEYRYVWNGQGYDKLPNGPQTGYGPTRDIAEPKFPERERPPEEPRYEEPQRPDPMDFRREQEAEEERRREQESRDRQREAEEYYFRMRNAQYEEPVAPQMPYYPEEPMPETYIEPEVNFSEDPGFYQPPVDYTPTRPVDYYNPSPPMDFTQDPGILQPTEPVYNPASKRGGDLAKLLADLIARKGGGGSLEEQRRLMELLGSIRG